ncbi:MAG TPA: bifunctional hydroxymethylpyrimidine kinase/phosphomethylpyrimidine kinase, partial [Solirubrobacteraceae bacterium]|nr:bifunctional hydroxymethylpyrimidine kinase/phosphomethylpyrimidine kinase [Solirubrobacteraceae bacterium]
AVLTPNVPEAHALARHASGRAPRETGHAVPGADAPGADAPPAADALSAHVTTGRPAPADPESRGERASRPDVSASEQAEMQALARAMLALGPEIVVLTGGHRTQAVDLFLDSSSLEQIVSIPGKRHPDGASHGSGCTHSSVLAAQLALGRPALQAAFAARALAGAAVAGGLRDVGEGPGPVDVIGLARLRRR